MKKVVQLYLIIFIAALAGCTGKTQRSSDNTLSASSDTGKAVLTFREYEHQFGKVDEGEKVGCIFTFENTGTSDLVILSATTTCGCTVPDYDRKPVSPGETGKLEVVFDTSGRNGIQSKVITVRSNASNPVVMLKITAEVINN
ncbi:MAG: DUF1573 domain-containing protein [Bacteroidia bacterium]|nr:DUF1573 domain-containing protein [Bacteroidia bacterium]